jgi:hypothetical protein
MPGIQFRPGNKGNIRKILKRMVLCADSSCHAINEKCICFKERFDKTNTGYTDSSQTQNARITQLVTQSLGGRTTFGNIGLRTNNTYLGGIEGQPGGSPRPPRNKF